MLRTTCPDSVVTPNSRLPGTAPSLFARPGVGSDLVLTPPRPPTPPKPRRGLTATTPATLELDGSPLLTLIGFQLIRTPGSSLCGTHTLPSTSREILSPFVEWDHWPPSVIPLAEASLRTIKRSLRMIQCKSVEGPWGPKLLMPDDEEPTL